MNSDVTKAIVAASQSCVHIRRLVVQFGNDATMERTVRMRRLDMANEMQPAIKPMRGEGQFFQALVANHIHEDGLFWGQIRTLMVLQGTMIPASYFLYPSVFSLAVIFLALLLTEHMRRVTNAIRRHRDANVSAIDKVARFIVDKELAEDIVAGNERLKSKGHRFHGDGLFLFAISAPLESHGPAKQLVSSFFWMSIICDVALLAGYVVCLVLGVTSLKCPTLANLWAWDVAALRCTSNVGIAGF